MKSLAVAVLLVLAPGASAAPSVAGAWFGEGQPDDKTEFWLARLGADGALELHTRACAHAKPRDHVSFGRWSQDAGGLTVTFPDGAFEASFTYKTLFNDGHVWRYRLTATNAAPEDIGYEFHSTRVAGDFDLPGCGPQVSSYFP